MHAASGPTTPQWSTSPRCSPSRMLCNPAGTRRRIRWPAWTELAGSLPDPAPACDCDFSDCALTPLAAPRFVRGTDPTSTATFCCSGPSPSPGSSYELQEASDGAFAAATVPIGGSVPALRRDRQAARARSSTGCAPSSGCASAPGRRPSRCMSASVATTRGRGEPDDLLAIHRLMLRTAAGRGDLLAVLGLPRHYRFSDAVAHASALRDPGGVVELAREAAPDRRRRGARAVARRALSPVAADPPRRQPSSRARHDGAVCGQLAAGALERGAWPARRQPAAARRRGAQCHGFARRRAAAAGRAGEPGPQRSARLRARRPPTRSSPEADWRPINVRRLMTLLRRLALRRGATLCVRAQRRRPCAARSSAASTR